MKPLLHTFFFCCVLASAAQAQSVFFAIGGGFSTVHPKSNYAFTYVSDPTGWRNKFEELSGQKADRGFHIASSLEFQLPDAPLELSAGIVYTQLYGKRDHAVSLSPPWYSTIYTIGPLTTRSNILTFRTGAQWQFSRSPIAPYVSLDLLYNIIGDTKLGISNGPSAVEAIADGNTRMGLSPGAGARVAFLPSMDLVIGANYSWVNLITPDSEEETRGALSLTASVAYRIF